MKTPNGRVIEVTDVFYVEHGANLFSLPKFLQKEWSVEMKRTEMILRNAKGRLLFKAPLQKNLWEVNLKMPRPHPQIKCQDHRTNDHQAWHMKSKLEQKFPEIWHYRLGHAHHRAVKRLLTNLAQEKIQYRPRH